MCNHVPLLGGIVLFDCLHYHYCTSLSNLQQSILPFFLQGWLSSETAAADLHSFSRLTLICWFEFILSMVTRLIELNLIRMLQVVFILADALPGFSNFYINYILLSSFLQAGHLWQVGDDAIRFTCVRSQCFPAMTNMQRNHVKKTPHYLNVRIDFSVGEKASFSYVASVEAEIDWNLPGILTDSFRSLAKHRGLQSSCTDVYGNCS